MHATANSPGHTYLIAGADSRLIIDNSQPNGRDVYSAGLQVTKSFNLLKSSPELCQKFSIAAFE